MASLRSQKNDFHLERLSRLAACDTSENNGCLHKRISRSRINTTGSCFHKFQCVSYKNQSLRSCRCRSLNEKDVFFSAAGAFVGLSPAVVVRACRYLFPHCCHLSARSWPEPPPLHTTAAHIPLPKSTSFQGGRKEEGSVISQKTRELFQNATWAGVEHVFIFTVRYEGLGTCHTAVSLWAPTLCSTQPQLGSTRSCLIPFINPI